MPLWCVGSVGKFSQFLTVVRGEFGDYRFMFRGRENVGEPVRDGCLAVGGVGCDTFQFDSRRGAARGKTCPSICEGRGAEVARSAEYFPRFRRISLVQAAGRGRS